MARAKLSDLAVKAKRLSLPISKNPVFEVLGDGVSVGYRRTAGAGTWVARRSNGPGRKIERRLGLADDFEDPDGVRVLSFGQAQAEAFKFDPAQAAADAKAKASARAPATVSQALDSYEADLKTRGGDVGNVSRIRFNIGRDLMEKTVKALEVADLREWRDALTTRLAASTVNRTSNAFKAALNLAADNDDAILTRNAWEKGLAALRDAEEARNIILTDAQVRAVVEAAYEQSRELGLLVEVSAVTGARYSQIAALTVGDLQDDRDAPRVMMPSSRKGSGIKKVLRRPVPLPFGLALKLRESAAGRPKEMRLLLKPPRPQTNAEKLACQPARAPEPWKQSDHYRPFGRAVAAAFGTAAPDEPAEADDAETDRITIYALRHSSIVRQILAGVPIRVVAVMHDTSVSMIEKNYSKYLADHSDTIARGAMLDLSGPVKNVISLKRPPKRAGG